MSGVGFECIGKLRFLTMDALVVIFGFSGVDFVPQGSYERSWLRNHWKIKFFDNRRSPYSFGMSGADFLP